MRPAIVAPVIDKLRWSC